MIGDSGWSRAPTMKAENLFRCKKRPKSKLMGGGCWKEDAGRLRSNFDLSRTSFNSPPIRIDSSVVVARFFPIGSAGGRGNLHMRAIERLPKILLDALVRMLHDMEESGRWPKVIGDVLVVLFAKPTGGFRPINLFPWPIRLWMRVRRDQASDWKCVIQGITSTDGKARGRRRRRG